jgi:hypothetical protein
MSTEDCKDQVRTNEKPDLAGQRNNLSTPPADKSTVSPKEIGGREGPDPTRYGDWEKNGRCIDF